MLSYFLVSHCLNPHMLQQQSLFFAFYLFYCKICGFSILISTSIYAVHQSFSCTFYIQQFSSFFALSLLPYSLDLCNMNNTPMFLWRSCKTEYFQFITFSTKIERGKDICYEYQWRNYDKYKIDIGEVIALMLNYESDVLKIRNFISVNSIIHDDNERLPLIKKKFEPCEFIDRQYKEFMYGMNGLVI